jgi:hypothetical protein
MSLLSRCAEGITARFTDAAMKPRGGATSGSIRWSQPGHYGSKRIGNRRLTAKRSSKAQAATAKQSHLPGLARHDFP